jgi:sensor domain CHASE-containing protein
MSVYVTSKKVRYITSVIFVLFMVFIVGGSYLAQQEQVAPESTSAS